MALITCWECGGKVSDSAATCPHCGAPLKGKAGPAAPAAEKPVEYEQCVQRVRCWGTSNKALQKALAKYIEDGWEVVTMTQDHWRGGTLSPVYNVTMRRLKK